VGPLVVARPDSEGVGTRHPVDNRPVDSLAIVSFNVNLGAASAIDLVDSLRAGAFTAGAQRLDFLFFRVPGGFETRPYRTLPFEFGSDHRPVMGWVRFAD
jgi:hypothetical protein